MPDNAKLRYILPHTDKQDDHSPGKSLKATLEELSVGNIKIINDRDWDLTSPEAKVLKEHVSPHFRTWVHNLSKPMTISFEDATAWIQKVVEEYPDYREEILDVTSDIDEKRGCATVIMHVRIDGHEQTSVEAIREARWERDDSGKWWLHNYVGIRGVSMDAVAMP